MQLYCFVVACVYLVPSVLLCVCLLQMGIHRGADLGGDRGGRSPPILNVGGKESLISPPIFHEYNKKMPQSPPIVALGGIWGDGGMMKKFKNFHLHPPPGREFFPEKNRPPQILRLGGDDSIFSLICPPQTHDQVGSPGYTYLHAKIKSDKKPKMGS